MPELSFTCLLSSMHTLRTRATLGLQIKVQAAVKQCSYMHYMWGRFTTDMRQPPGINDGQSHWNPSWHPYISKSSINNQGIIECCCTLADYSEIKNETETQLVQISTCVSFFSCLPTLHHLFYLLSSWRLQKHFLPLHSTQCQFHSSSALYCFPVTFLALLLSKEICRGTVSHSFLSSFVQMVDVVVFLFKSMTGRFFFSIILLFLREKDQ